MRLRFERFVDNEKCTLGRLLTTDVDKLLICYTMERPKYTMPVCIPVGVYKCVQYVSPKVLAAQLKKGMKDAEAEKVAKVWLLMDVPGRKFIEIHCANTPDQIRGCIAPGMVIKKNKDGIEQSRVALDKLTKTVGGWDATWELEIVSV